MATGATKFFNAVVRPHVQMIRFRKGALVAPHIDAPSSSVSASAQPIVEQVEEPVAGPAASGSKQWSAVSLGHEWWDTPVKFKRRKVDDMEIDIINSGGSDRLFR